MVLREVAEVEWEAFESTPEESDHAGGSMSRPILERLGFERVGEVHMLLDRFA